MYAVDPYSGVGLFSAGLAERVGVTGRVSAVESADGDDAVANLADLPQVDQVAGGGPAAAPAARAPTWSCWTRRAGAKRAAVEGSSPWPGRRDLRRARLRAALVAGLDLFPMTHHVECVALTTR